jgi:hypothetical protein
MTQLVERRVNRLSFIGGSLRPKGTVVAINSDILKPRSERGGEERADNNNRVRNSNLSPVGKMRAVPEVEMAAIAPTGPNPVMPQHVPPGTIQTGAGRFSDGARLIAEGTRETSIVPAEGLEQPPMSDLDDDTEEEETTTLDLGTDGVGEDDEDTQVASAIVEGSVGEVEKALVGLNAEQLDAVEQAEKAGQDRAGVANAIKAARGRLAE